jgi:CRP-like cAMP-binding protein
LLAVTPSDKAIELAMVGRDGVVGLPLLFGGTSMPYEALVQVAGTALTIAADVLRAEFNRARRLQQLLLGYERRLHAQLSRAVLCHRFHNLPSRIGRWLLNASDRLGSDTIEVTQEGLAYVLNAPRTAVNAAAVKLCDSGTIRYRHGRIVISDRAALSRAACPCYRLADRRAEAARSAS